MLKWIFIFSLNLVFYTSASEPTSDTEPTKEEKQKANYNKMLGQREALVRRAKNKWDLCRQQCRFEHTKPKENCDPGPDHNTYCFRPYTNEECDIEFCSAKKTNYEELKNHLKDMRAAQSELDKKKKESGPASQSPLEQVKKKKKDTGLLTVVAAGTTAFLWAKANACCASPSCSSCSLLRGMAVAAGAQTFLMATKKNELGETARAMCVSANDPSCTGDSDQGGSDDGDDIAPPVVPPGCTEAGLSPEQCGQFIGTIDPPPGECPPDEPNCKANTPAPSPTAPNTPGGSHGNTGSFTGWTPKQIEKLDNIFKPKGGWPNGKSPFSEVGSEPFDYNKLTPAQKKQSKQIMANLNKKNKAFLEKHGLAGGSSSAGGVDDTDGDSEDASGAVGLNGKSSPTGSSGVSAKFGQMSDDTRSLAGLEDSMAQGGHPAKAPAGSIAEQMQNMLKKMHGMSGGSSGGDGSGFLGDKSVLVGDDNVGVREDNIFMMVHRMNQKLNHEERFIKTVSF